MQFRRKAEVCRQRAEACQHEDRRSHWLFMEREWLYLAESAENLLHSKESHGLDTGALPETPVTDQKTY
jgi:hypothetical protein